MKEHCRHYRDNAQRLAGVYEVRGRELPGGGDARELRVENGGGPALSMRVLYGTGTAAARAIEGSRAERSSQTAALAWSRERMLVQAGFGGRGEWSKSQRAELVSGRRVRGYVAVEIHPSTAFPSLAGDPDNYVFVPESSLGSHRRRSRHGKARRGHA